MKVGRIFRWLLPVLFVSFAWMFWATTVFAAGIYLGGTTGNDISYPQCSTSSYPKNSFGVVGVTGGRAFTDNSCLTQEFAWAKALSTPASLYMNLNSPIGPTASKGMTGPYGNCSKKDKLCQAENYGYNAAQDAYNYATSKSASSSMWWLDIETGNSWSSSMTLNQGTVNGAAKFFTLSSINVGIYSTQSMWNSITGGYKNMLPVWIATSSTTPATYCSTSYSFTGGSMYLVQYSNAATSVDSDYAC
ncbi:MAG: hypothetical protein NVS4B12_02150 [Ktedonobacteraceae bacterium]